MKRERQSRYRRAAQRHSSIACAPARQRHHARACARAAPNPDRSRDRDQGLSPSSTTVAVHAIYLTSRPSSNGTAGRITPSPQRAAPLSAIAGGDRCWQAVPPVITTRPGRPPLHPERPPQAQRHKKMLKKINDHRRSSSRLYAE